MKDRTKTAPGSPEAPPRAVVIRRREDPQAGTEPRGLQRKLQADVNAWLKGRRERR